MKTLQISHIGIAITLAAALLTWIVITLMGWPLLALANSLLDLQLDPIWNASVFALIPSIGIVIIGLIGAIERERNTDGN